MVRLNSFLWKSFVSIRLTKIFFIFLAFSFQIYSQSPPITIMFGGDCTFSNSFSANIKSSEVRKVFENIPWMAQADITMVNLESCISTRGDKLEKEFNFRMHPKYLPVLKYGGIDIVTLANNHIVDYGLIGMKDTFYYLDSMGIKYVGAGLNIDEARRPAVINVRGKKIGFLAYSFAFSAISYGWGTAPIDTNIIKQDLQKLKEVEKADYIIVNFHWGREGDNNANNEQQKFGRFAIDNGANIVVGHHPHVLQGIENYNFGYIAYSLGNFIFGGNSRKQHYTILLKVEIDKDKIKAEPIPIEVKNFCAYPVEPAKRDSILNLIKEYSLVLSK